MPQEPQPHHPIHDLIKRRWSPRAFEPNRLVPAQDLRRLLEAARWAASSFNEQPWSYLVATRDNPAEFERMLSCLLELNQRWAKNAAVLMISVVRKTFTHNNNPNRVALHDVGAASAQLTFAATELGLHVHQMAGIDMEKTSQTYQIPDGYDPVAAIAIGYVADPTTLPEDLQKKEVRTGRKPQNEWVFTGKWGQASKF